MSTADIFGIGIDIVSVVRVREVLRRHPVRFPRKVLHPQEEIEYRDQSDPSRFLARRFAVKEAVVKALGLGFTGGAYARKIQIKHDARGRPLAVLPRDLPASHRHCKALLSITDERDYAVAQAIVLNEEPPL